MQIISSLFKGLRAKLILTYTLVTVLALLALELLAIVPVAAIAGLVASDLGGYMTDVKVMLVPQARSYLQPGKEDLPGLQAWLEGVVRSRYASLPAQSLFDSPAAEIIRSEPVYVLSKDGVVLAQVPLSLNNLIGRQYTRPQYANGGLYTRAPSGNYLMEIPVTLNIDSSDKIGVIVMTVAPPPSLLAQMWPFVAGGVLLTGLLLLVVITPFGALFGLVMSRGLTRRLARLTAAADAWSEGNFTVVPLDNASDEISLLGKRMRHMAERIQALLQARQELATLEERNRFARELHDTVKQNTFATLMQVRAARNLLSAPPAQGDSPSGAIERLVEAESLLKDTQKELGLLIAELRPAELEGKGLSVALQDYLQTWSQHACIPADLQVKNSRGLPLEIEQAMFRVAQEALSNVARHSRASAVTLRLEFTSTAACLEIVDNGAGFDPAIVSGGFGLQSMRERMAAVSGVLNIESTPGSGALVRAAVPIPKGAA